MSDDLEEFSSMKPDIPDDIASLRPVATLNWSSLIECALDEAAALRQSSEYARSTLFKNKVDSLTECLRELERRLESMKCVPGADEPSFTLLARDPQAPGLVRFWADVRSLVEPSKPDKVAEARAVADRMEAWKGQHPGVGLAQPAYDAATRRVLQDSPEDSLVRRLDPGLGETS